MPPFSAFRPCNLVSQNAVSMLTPRDINTLMRPPLAATGVSAGLAMFEDATQSLIDLAATTTSPVMVQICDAFVSPEFKLVALTEWIRNAPDCPSIADNPVVVAEWALVADHLNALKVDSAKQVLLSRNVDVNKITPLGLKTFSQQKVICVLNNNFL